MRMLKVWAVILGFLMFLFGYRRKILRKNWKQLICGRVIQKYGFYKFLWNYYYWFSLILLESVKGYSMSFEQLSKYVMWVGDDKVREVLARGQSAVLLLSHFNNWEWLSSLLPSFFQCEVYAVYKPFKNPYIDKYVLRDRENHGMHLFALKQIREMVKKALKGPSLMIFLADQRPPRSDFSRAVWVEFCKKNTAFAHGPESIVEKFSLPVFYVQILREGDKYRFTFIELHGDAHGIITPDITRKYVHMLEEDIKLQPTHYIWSHDRWKFQ